jgi:2-methylcitrate dehydratase
MIDRRSLLLAAGGLATAAATQAQSPDRRVSRGDSSPRRSAGVPAAASDAAPTTVTADLIRFARTLRYEDLREPVVHAAKRYVLDTLGCAVAGHQTDKGRIAAAAMGALGGTPQARIVGGTARVSVNHAAFANGELSNALDYDAIPHIPPFILPPILAMAEHVHASGRALILAVVIAHEVAARLSAASGQGGPGLLEQAPHPVMGINDESVIAAAAGLVSLLHLDDAIAGSALGLAGYYCPPRASGDWEIETPLTMVKYTPAGWVCQAAVTATLLAQAGFTGVPAVLDGPRGFPYYYGWERWNPHLATEGLRETWKIEDVDFKPYACCRFLHSQLDCMIALVAKHHLRAEEIERIVALGVPLPANPDKMNVRTQTDAQFSTPYMLALAASGIPLDARCQSAARLTDPRIRQLMRRITWGSHPDADAARRRHPHSYIARVEVTAGSRNYVEESLFPRGTASAGMALSDAQLEAKCRANLETALPADTAAGALERLWRLEQIDDVTELVDRLVVARA